jgi:acetyl-CoA acetyltransferase
MCGSGMKAAMLASDLLTAGSMDIVVAGGMPDSTNFQRNSVVPAEAGTPVSLRHNNFNEIPAFAGKTI